MKTNGENIKERVQNAMMSDRNRNADQLLQLLKSDLSGLFKEYFETDGNALDVTISQEEDGDITLLVQLKAQRVLDFGNIL